MPTTSRDLHGPTQSRAIRDLFQSLFVAELINPSPKLWLFFAWISDVEILDNSARQFAALVPDWPAAPIRLSQVLQALISRGVQVRLIIREHGHNEYFTAKLQSLKERYGDLVKWTIEKSFHAKGLLGADYFLSGSMNLTLTGISVNGETSSAANRSCGGCRTSDRTRIPLGGSATIIGVDIEAARTIARDLSALGEFSVLEPDAAELCATLVDTVADPDFPGAVIPNVDAAGNLRLFIAAPTMTAWRRLSPALRAFAGPTLTSFNGLLEPLPQGDLAADIVMQLRPAAAGVIRLPQVARNRLSALRARETLARAPNLQHAAPEPTSWLIAHFQDYLNVGRRDAATDILMCIKRELRLDSLNLKFLEVQLLAAFDDWSGIVDIPGFANLCLARRSPAITALLLEALYKVHLADPFDASDTDETRTRYETAVRPLALPMLSVPVPLTLKEGGWRIYGLESWIAPSRTDIAPALIHCHDMLGWIDDRLALAALGEEMGRAVEPTPLDNARDALVQVDAVESVDTVATALAALAKLSPEELARLHEAEPFRSTLQVTDDVADIGLPTSWTD